MTDNYTVTLSHDEAIVLFEFFSRFSTDGQPLEMRNNAEFVALMSVSSQLERLLVAPFEADYVEQVDAARKRLTEGYEGTAPGVKLS